MCVRLSALGDRRNNNVIVKTNRVYEAYKVRLLEPHCSAAVSQCFLLLDFCLLRFRRAMAEAAAGGLVVVVVVAAVCMSVGRNNKTFLSQAA